MNRWLIFGGGFLSGIIATLLVFVIINVSKQGNEELRGATMFDQPGQVINEYSFKVMQVIQDNAALVNAPSWIGDEWYEGTSYLIINNDGEYYYNDQIIYRPNGKHVRQIGLYKYTTKSGDDKTVPIIKIMD